MENFLTALVAFLTDPVGIFYFMAALFGGASYSAAFPA